MSHTTCAEHVTNNMQHSSKTAGDDINTEIIVVFVTYPIKSAWNMSIIK